MKTMQDFINNVGKTVIFTKQFDMVFGDVVDFEEYMKAKIVDVLERNSEGIFKVIFDFSDYVEHNRKYMSANYFDKNHNPCLTWEQTNYFPVNYIVEVYFDKDCDYTNYFIVETEVEKTYKKEDILKILKKVELDFGYHEIFDEIIANL